jgi:hypothetical protein
MIMRCPDVPAAGNVPQKSEINPTTLGVSFMEKCTAHLKLKTVKQYFAGGIRTKTLARQHGVSRTASGAQNDAKEVRCRNPSAGD